MQFVAHNMSTYDLKNDMEKLVTFLDKPATVAINNLASTT
jgi:hypothetical protein